MGKSTIFNCLSSAKAQAANFPFCTIEPNVGVITVPDERLTKLAEIVHPGRIVPATCEIVDIAGPARAKVWATSSSETYAKPTPSYTCCAASTTTTSLTLTAA